MNNKFKALSPIIEDELQMNKLKHYFEALDYSLDDKETRIRNIAVTGDYGSGKSTVIESYIHNRDLSNKTITISFATFNLQKDQDINKPEDKSEKVRKEIQKLQHERQDVELSILQQLIYHARASDLPLSRFKRIHNVTGLNLLAHITTLLIIGCVLAAIYYSLIDYDKDASNTYKLTLGTGFIIFGICVSNLSFLKKLYSGNHFLGKVNLMRGELSFNDQKSEVKDESLLNIYLDEIVYFFEVTEYQYVILEDLDRLEHVDIFIKLREINQIINASRKNASNVLGTSTVKFIYAIKDTLFVKPEDKTKFFDFIMPIIPVLDHDNSKNLLIDELKRLDLKISINPQMLSDLSIYLTDMRLVRNIVNEFCIYLQKDGLDSNHSNFYLDQLFALIVYKNLMPQDFTDLRLGQGALYSVVKDYRSGVLRNKGVNKYVNEKLKELQEVIDKSNIDEEIIDKLSELNSAKEDSGLLKDLIILLEIYDKDNIYQEYFYDCLEDTTVLKLCLKKGYIDHSYVDYISLSHNTAREVTAFRKSLNQEIGDVRKAFFMPLSNKENIEQVLLDMDLEYEYRNASILNRDLITYLVNVRKRSNSIYSTFLDKIFCHHFKNELLYPVDFIRLFYENSTGSTFSEFMKLSHGQSDKHISINLFIKNFRGKDSTTLGMYWHMLFHIPSSFAKKSKSDYLIFIIQQNEIINAYSEFPSVDNLVIFLSQIDFKINLELPKEKPIKQSIFLKFDINKAKITLCYQNSEKIFMLVYRQHSYNLTIKNIKIILSYFKILDDFDSAHLTSIKKYSENELKPLSEYIHENINEYITNVYLKLDDNINESLETILYLLNHPDLKLSNKQKIIIKQKFIINDLSSLEKDSLLQNFMHEEVIDNE
ncbi:hypothetical protein PE074_10000 (plasmid) [Wohlfahrtiimonas chitiniclastica]|uniref:YobI family P-loop NTPase n=1 Tax=Wohlfahrtiimonas chitiniclastica TaxID=400946 RepID=UPI0007BE8ED2|nr:hypothetical protein [Wohlfahrtiimonas chitiniclastica]KZS22128.1 hypothetical protein BMY_2140 [Wohlfahrtiimonas chitiniclastica]WHR56431.1 hypothetical protein PE074_10000 [Wohlfahrtiimonas chitiniclastica]